MRTGNLRVAAGAAALAALFVLAGCVETERLPTLPPTPTATPLFASEEEAIEAAKQAYQAYFEISSVVGSEGGADPNRIAPFVTPARLDDELRGAALLSDNDLRITGSSTFEVIDVQRVDLGDDVVVVFYACWDGSATRVIDASGSDVTPAERVERAILEVQVTTVGGRLPLLVDRDDQWSDDPC